MNSVLTFEIIPTQLTIAPFETTLARTGKELRRERRENERKSK